MKYDLDKLKHLPLDHPASIFLDTHAKFCQQCIAFELPISKYYNNATNIQWYSDVLGKHITLAGMLYGEFSFTPEMDGWIAQPPHPTQHEISRLHWIESRHQLLEEARICAEESANSETVEIIVRAKEVLAAWSTSIHARIDALQ